jgi:hypothetical protein
MMETLSDVELSAELQELYLQNKQWLSDVLFLEDETRFFRKIFSRVASAPFQETSEVHYIHTSLGELEDHRNMLKKLVLSHQKSLEALLGDMNLVFGLELMEENTRIIREIQELFALDRSLKVRLFLFVADYPEQEGLLPS